MGRAEGERRKLEFIRDRLAIRHSEDPAEWDNLLVSTAVWINTLWHRHKEDCFSPVHHLTSIANSVRECFCTLRLYIPVLLNSAASQQCYPGKISLHGNAQRSPDAFDCAAASP